MNTWRFLLGFQDRHCYILLDLQRDYQKDKLSTYHWLSHLVLLQVQGRAESLFVWLVHSLQKFISKTVTKVIETMVGNCLLDLSSVM